MQIKRFQGPDMTETLRRVKEEFGDNAVILSAKEIRSGGFFKGMRKKCVEVTAAIDKASGREVKENPFSTMLASQLDDSSLKDRVTLTSKGLKDSSKSNGGDSLTVGKECPPTDRDNAQTDPAELAPERAKEDCSLDEATQKYRENHRYNASRCSYFLQRPSNSVAPPFYGQVDRQHRIAVVGANGAGKSSSLAKLALHCKKIERLEVAILSLDRFSIGANGLVEAFARRMSLPFSVVFDECQLRDALDAFSHSDVILIDTPGLSAADDAKTQAVATLLGLSKAKEVHWVANATVRMEHHLADAQRFVSMNATHLLFTHMEETVETDSLQRLMNEVDLPLGFVSDGTDVFDPLKEADAKWMHRKGGAEYRGKMTWVEAERETPRHKPHLVGKPSPSEKRDIAQNKPVVVNGKSELFHDPECPLVKRFDPKTINVLSSTETAVEMGHKPCPVCFNPLSNQRNEPQQDTTIHATDTEARRTKVHAQA